MSNVLIEGGEGSPKEIPKRTDLLVPFSEKDWAKSLGARWDAKNKIWYIPAGQDPRPFKSWWTLPSLTEFAREDRTFGGNGLFVDLIPITCWFTNVRYCISAKDWLRVRTLVYNRVKNVCEICGDGGSGLDAHERWEYDVKKKIQRLKRLICLCKPCHQTTHYGYAEINGNGQEAIAHLCLIAGLSPEDAKHHIEAAFEVWNQRSTFQWHLDITMLTDVGITIERYENKTERKKISEDFLDTGIVP